MSNLFNPQEEFTAGRYIFDENLGFGKFNRCYSIPMLDINGKSFALGTFQDDHVDFVNNARLPDGVFVPTISQMEAWNRTRIGENWHERPQEVLKTYGVKFYGDAYHREIENVDEIVYLASSSRNLDGNRAFLVVGRSARFSWYERYQCAFVPVFFDREFLSASR